jgi:hypothetical protein
MKLKFPSRNGRLDRHFSRNSLAGRVIGAAALALAVLLLEATFAAAPRSAPTPSQPSTAGPRDYASFKLIAERNIFNANRSRRSGRASSEERKPNRVDTVTLVGMLTYEKGPYAFFDGSSSDYRKVLGPGKTIAGYTIEEITGTGVKLNSGTNTVELQVGSQMRREEGGEWHVVGGSRAQASTAGATSSGDSTEPAGEESDIVKRLMQQREQELK